MTIRLFVRRAWHRHHENRRLNRIPLFEGVSVRSHTAAALKWWSRIAQGLEQGLNINAQDDTGRTLLHHTTWNSDLLRRIVSHGGNPNATDHDGITPLMVACLKWDSTSMDVLLKAGASPHSIAWRGKSEVLRNTPQGDDFSYSGKVGPIHPNEVTDAILMALYSCTLWDSDGTDISRRERFATFEKTVIGPMGNKVPAFSLEPWYIPGTHLDHPMYPHLVAGLRSGRIKACSALTLNKYPNSIVLDLLKAGADPYAHAVPHVVPPLNLLNTMAVTHDDSDVISSHALALIKTLLSQGVSACTMDEQGQYPWQKHNHPTCRALLLRAYEIDLLHQSVPEDAVTSVPRPRRRL